MTSHFQVGNAAVTSRYFLHETLFLRRSVGWAKAAGAFGDGRRAHVDVSFEGKRIPTVAAPRVERGG